jgi:superfamily II DNA or RNA helicase
VDAPPLNFDEEPAMQPFRLRKYQEAWIQAIEEDRRAGLTRMLVDASGGTGKTTVFAALAFKEWHQYQGRTLVLENRDKLVSQTAQRIEDETGMEVSIEQADLRADPCALIVVASVQTLGRINRLCVFNPDHFSLVVPDESHHALSPQWRRVLSYFHYGDISLTDDWKQSDDGTYEVRAHIVGFTATPDIGKKSLGEFFQKYSVRYSYLDAVEDGWLVPPIAERKPLSANLRGLKTGRTPNGSDLKTEELSARLVPIVGEMAKQIVEFASNRKTIAFVPSVECARLLADACRAQGLRAIFVSGECLDVDEKTAAFVDAPRGTVLCNCALYVEGADFPDVDCVAWFRPTVSRAFFVQGVYRGTRVLPDIVSDDMTAEERREAIAGSAKPNVLIIDPLWVTDDISLCSVLDLVTDKPEVKEKMQEMEGLDLIGEAEKATRDWEKALEKAAKKHARKQAQRVDPLQWAMTISEDQITNYQPRNANDERPPTVGQVEYMDRNHIARDKITSFGLAQKIIGIHVSRFRQGLATMQQLEFLSKLGLGDKITPLLKVQEASAMIDAFKTAREGRR